MKLFVLVAHASIVANARPGRIDYEKPLNYVPGQTSWERCRFLNESELKSRHSTVGLDNLSIRREAVEIRQLWW